MPIKAGRHCCQAVTQRVSNTQHTLADDKQPVFFEGLFVCDALNHTLAAHLCFFFFFYEPFLRLGGALVVTIYRLQSSEVNINRIMKQSLQSVLMMEEIRGVICGG